MAAHLVLFTITPVQRFITTARKTEDLWVGSYILSFLNATAIAQVHGQDGLAMIYPDSANRGPFDFWASEDMDITLPSFPNVFLAHSATLAVDQLRALMQQTEHAVQTAFAAMAAQALDTVFALFRDKDWRGSYAEELFEQQVRHFFDLYWAISPSPGGTYQDWYEKTGARLAAVKNCRAFAPIRESGRKCSLCGEREILHRGVGNPMQFWRTIAQRRPKYCRLDEALCIVCLTKRVGAIYFGQFHTAIRDLSFQSTSEVATADFKDQLVTSDEALDLYKTFIRAVRTLTTTHGSEGDIRVSPVPKLQGTLPRENIDGDWLFEESFEPHNLERYYGISRETQHEQRQSIAHCQMLRKQLCAKVGGEASRYYAVIVLDGDDMGKTITTAAGPPQHAEISRRLNLYTQSARQVVDRDHLGKLLYAGGDDVLALSNLQALLPILQGLQQRFPELVDGVRSTISAGVCIAHCKVPLGEVLRHARDMEQLAKKVDGKDALGLALFRHSGNMSQSVCKWRYAEDLDVLDTAQRFVRLIREGAVSKRFLYNFRDTFGRLADRTGKLPLPNELVEAELVRLIQRASDETQQVNDDMHQRRRTCVQQLTALLRQTGFTHFVSYLEIVNFIAREGKVDAGVS